MREEGQEKGEKDGESEEGGGERRESKGRETREIKRLK